MSVLSFLDDFYKTTKNDGVAFGDKYKAPVYIRQDWVKVAHYKKYPNGDGQPVDVYESRYPARFYKMVALESKNSVGEPLPSWSIGTGSGSDSMRLIAQIAQAVSDGMLNLNHDDK